MKKNASLKDGFYYNMSGLYLIYDGQELVKEKAVTGQLETYGNIQSNKKNSVSFVETYHYRFKAKYKVDRVVPESPAAKAGFLKDDIIKSINGKPAYNFTLGEIIQMFKKKLTER
ncbi:PDZ domain-containing protein [Tenacibaculum soleae]|uniref:PDZ domain-containing protein n=1 Tax=Tenacibaculum soleae TaxID=447689 RepID=UPI0026E40B08|nr:PDZ domain-containing protein [Tenacibaculum soleae]MDO6812520.1 PDZ domain-containing protein [Tenacibaculum soleae]